MIQPVSVTDLVTNCGRPVSAGGLEHSETRSPVFQPARATAQRQRRFHVREPSPRSTSFMPIKPGVETRGQQGHDAPELVEPKQYLRYYDLIVFGLGDHQRPALALACLPCPTPCPRPATKAFASAQTADVDHAVFQRQEIPASASRLSCSVPPRRPCEPGAVEAFQ